jgi:Holliday junction resolvase RusA-like endonuclease
MSNHTPRLRPKPDPKAIACLKLRILKAWQSKLAEIKEPEMKGRATRDFVGLFNSGLLLPKGFTEPKHISRASLYGWARVYKEKGLDGLIPKYKWRREMANNLVPMVPIYKRIVIPANPGLRFKERIFLPEIREQWKWPPLHCPVMVVMRFFMAIPKGVSMRARMEMLNHERPHLGTPHLEKLIAFAKSCLREIVWKDDRQIIVLHAEKHYEWVQEDAKTEIFIRQLKG